VESLLATFVGPQEQTPPAFSAAKVTGRRAYDLARAGRTVVLTPRRVEIYAVELLSYDYPLLEVDVSCGKGTYIRSLARDLGERLSCGGYVESLRRTAVGPFLVEKAVTLDVDAEFARSQVQPAGGAVAELTRAELTAADVERLRRGQGVALPDGLVGEVAVFNAAGRLVVVAAADPERRVLRPEKVFG
jgi:tRNA pseudouridine55 synthase